MSKMRIYILAAVAAAGIGLGGTFGHDRHNDPLSVRSAIRFQKQANT